MKAVVFPGVGDVRLDDVPEPRNPASRGMYLRWLQLPIVIVRFFVELVRAGAVDPSALVTQVEDAADAIEAYEQFDRRRPGWLKFALVPAAVRE